MTAWDIPTVVLVSAGCFFFMAGTVGLIRLPDLFSRLHALTKADNLGLGLIAAGVAWHLGSGWVAAKLIMIWAFTLLASSTACYLIARFARNEKQIRGNSRP